MGPVDLWYYTGVTLESIWVRDTWFTSSHWSWINNWQCWLQTPIFIKLDLPIFYWVFFWFSGLQRVQTLIVTTAQLQTKKPSDGFIRTMPNNFFGRSWMRRLRKYFFFLCAPFNLYHLTTFCQKLPSQFFSTDSPTLPLLYLFYEISSIGCLD